MIDIKLIRENRDLVKENIKKKFQDEKLPLVDEVYELDKRVREVQTTVDGLKADKNKLSSEIGKLMSEKKVDEANKVKEKIAESADEIKKLEEEQVKFYNRMKKEFLNTSLDYGVRNTWFAEFNPTYCTNCDNCGEKFFLLERDGNIYSCVRGQKQPDFYYGNIYNDSVEDIMNNAKIKIFQDITLPQV